MPLTKGILQNTMKHTGIGSQFTFLSLIHEQEALWSSRVCLLNTTTECPESQEELLKQSLRLHVPGSAELAGPVESFEGDIPQQIRFRNLLFT